MKKITSKIFKSIIFMSLIAISSIVMAIEPEKRSMQEIYQAALKEGGIVFMLEEMFNLRLLESKKALKKLFQE